MDKLSCMHVCTAARRYAAACKAWGNETPRAIWAVSEIENVRARNRLTESRTRGSPPANQAAGIIWPIDVLVSRRRTD
jgi:hypothetical protein